jgi:anthranilate synthase component 1
MIKPSKNELKDLLSKGNMIPIYVSIPGDLLTPVSAYLKISENIKHSFLFESVEGGSKIARYSFLGASPREIFKTNNKDPLEGLENRFKDISYVENPDLPPFSGGAVGYISYECVKYFEKATRPQFETFCSSQINDYFIRESVFMIFDTIVVFDHLKHKIFIVSHYISSSFNERIYETAVNKIDSLISLLKSSSLSLPRQPSINKIHECRSNVQKEGFQKHVEFLKSHILDGDIIQAVPSQRISKPTNLHPFNAYRELRQINPSPYMFYIDLEDFQIVGTSPEIMCKVSKRIVFSHPIAGTRKRGKNDEEDKKLASELLADEKERAEHTM